MHILVTSRDEVDICDGLNPDASKEIGKNPSIDQDIVDFISSRFELDRKLRKNWLLHKDKIQQALAEGAQGV